MSGYEDLSTIVHAPGWTPVPGQRTWPCRRCALSALAGKSDGACVQGEWGADCLRCEQAKKSNGPCVPIPKAGRRPLRMLVELRQLGTIGRTETGQHV